ncbi:MAG: glycerol-3-phosphate 1-O-acyltransferase PlsY [Dehalococcoidia bacterium]
MEYFIYIFIGYTIGSIPFGYILTKIISSKNLLEIGSGSTGATNVTRVLGLKIGIIVFLLDFCKGFVLVLFLRQALDNNLLIACTGSAIIIGHCWPIFLKFKGGKGVAPGVGTFSAIAYEIVLLPTIMSLICIYKTKTASIGSLIGIVFSFIPFIVLIILNVYEIEYLIYYLISISVILVRHKENINRLINKNERSF